MTSSSLFLQKWTSQVLHVRSIRCHTAGLGNTGSSVSSIGRSAVGQLGLVPRSLLGLPVPVSSQVGQRSEFEKFVTRFVGRPGPGASGFRGAVSSVRRSLFKRFLWRVFFWVLRWYWFAIGWWRFAIWKPKAGGWLIPALLV